MASNHSDERTAAMTTQSIDPVEFMIEAGMTPADEIGTLLPTLSDQMVDWFAKTYEGVVTTNSGRIVTCAYSHDELIIRLADHHDVGITCIRFPAPAT